MKKKRTEIEDIEKVWGEAEDPDIMQFSVEQHRALIQAVDVQINILNEARDILAECLNRIESK